MLINVKGKAEAMQDLEKAKKLIDEAGKILYRVPTKIEFEVSSTEEMILKAEQENVDEYHVLHLPDEADQGGPGVQRRERPGQFPAAGLDCRKSRIWFPFPCV